MVSGQERALRLLWSGRCDVFIRETAADPLSGRDEPREVRVLADEPCRLSFSSISTTQETGAAARVQQTARLFLAREAQVPPGSRIVVTQNGVTRVFTRAGESAVYSGHQEIMLETAKEWA